MKVWTNSVVMYEVGRGYTSLPQYSQWHSMRSRCRIGSAEQVRNECYLGCTHDPSWHSYDVWMDWAKQQIGFLNRDEKGAVWQLDKDILIKGNKYYSPETCVFVPAALNKFLTNSRAARGEHPVGVIYHKANGNYIAAITRGTADKKHLGCFATPEAAFQTYKVAKEDYARKLAIKYAGLVDPRVTDALSSYTVNIDD